MIERDTQTCGDRMPKKKGRKRDDQTPRLRQRYEVTKRESERTTKSEIITTRGFKGKQTSREYSGPWEGKAWAVRQYLRYSQAENVENGNWNIQRKRKQWKKNKVGKI